jgi:hypothetical protein
METTPDDKIDETRIFISPSQSFDFFVWFVFANGCCHARLLEN